MTGLNDVTGDKDFPRPFLVAAFFIELVFLFFLEGGSTKEAFEVDEDDAALSNSDEFPTISGGSPFLPFALYLVVGDLTR